jgi:multiple sugar transport system ATP-binding protein
MYDHPDNVFVAGFIGSPAMNLLDVPVTDGGVKFGDALMPISRDDAKDLGSHVTVGVRPEDLDLTDSGQGLAVTVDVVEELGADAYIYGQSQAHLVDAEASDEEVTSKPFIARVDGRRPPEKGQTIWLKPRQGHLHMFNADSGLRMGD